MEVKLIFVPVMAALLGSNVPSQSPPQFHGSTSMQVVLADQPTIDVLCGKAQPPNIKVACAQRHTRTIVIPNPCGIKERYAGIFCHELAHINGWQHKDPGGTG